MPFDPKTDQLIPIKLTPARREALLKQVRDHYAEADSARGSWPDRHERRYRRFLADRQLRGRGPWLNAPRIFTPDTQNVLDKTLAQLHTGVFPGFEALMLEPFDERAVPHLDKALQTERWALRYLINDADQGGFGHISRMALFDGLMDGAGFLKVYPWRQPFRDAVPERLIRIDNVDEGMLLLPPGATGTQYPEAEYLGQDVYVRWDDLLRMKREGYTIPKKEDLKAEAAVLTERQRVEIERTGREIPDAGGQYLVTEMYERFVLDPKEDEEEDDIIVSFFPKAGDDDALARAILLKDRFPYVDRPRRPFFPLVVWQQPRQLRGLNVVDKIEQLQDLVNRLTEQMVGYGDITLSPMFFYNAMLTGEMGDLTQVMPGQGVPVNDLSGVQVVPRPSLNRHFLEQMTEHRTSIERTSSISDLGQGMSATRPNAPRTAAGTAMLRQAQSQSFSILVKLLGVQLQAPLQFHWQLMQHYAPPGLQVPLKRVYRLGGQGAARPALPPVASGLSEGATAGVLGAGGQPGNGPQAPAGAPGPQGAPAAQAEDLLAAEEAFLVAGDVAREDLAGTFLIKLKVNPDLPFDRQVITQLSQWLYPILAGKYPIGARLLLKRLFEVNNQPGFEQMYPASVAMIETQALFSAIVKQAQAQHQQPPGGGDGGAPQVPPQVQAAQHAHAVSEAHHGMQQHGHETRAKAAQAHVQEIKLLQELQKLLMDGQPQNGGG